MKRVWGGMFFHPQTGKQVRGIIAGTAQEAANATSHSVHHIRGYWSITGNEQEIRIANSQPGVLFWSEGVSRHYRALTATASPPEEEA